MLHPPQPHAPDPFFDGDEPLLDFDAVEDAFAAPRRLSREESRVAIGPDWAWTHLTSDEETADD
ncbi:hypothetical protein [Brevundimonas sp. NIBR11]|uniref:hypothetical protein n=1 Tax=Brevundimonas sp. NIBR11 TaxID=3015999 RepID=UPI0022F12182|nr:hypothetical protein [Brevundimonas sp. NIBR11]WGM30406.1 hypothetical protein KKHFBJBL_00629 [Brevundimonas sp. NIBR11]